MKNNDKNNNNSIKTTKDSEEYEVVKARPQNKDEVLSHVDEIYSSQLALITQRHDNELATLTADYNRQCRRIEVQRQHTIKMFNSRFCDDMSNVASLTSMMVSTPPPAYEPYHKKTAEEQGGGGMQWWQWFGM
jgi:molecular chaperone GrpE (heat shock protein)